MAIVACYRNSLDLLDGNANFLCTGLCHADGNIREKEKDEGKRDEIEEEEDRG